MIKLHNSQLTVQCKLHGAELCSIKDSTGTEYLWQADSNHWGRHAPVLFPIVGKLAENTYRIKGKSYPLGQHGFARDQVFELVESSGTSATFVLTENEDTLSVYPFKFKLEIIYTLRNNALTVHYLVENTGRQPMWATIGAHPAFNCPIEGQGKRSDYSLVFDQEESAGKHLLEGGNFNGETKLVLDSTNTLPITDDLFDDDALVFKHLHSTGVTLQNGEGKPVVRMEYSGFPYLGIWSKSRKSPFVCLEPWQGLADTKDFRGDFSEKEGMRKLEAGESFSCQYRMIFGG